MLEAQQCVVDDIPSAVEKLATIEIAEEFGGGSLLDYMDGSTEDLMEKSAEQSAKCDALRCKLQELSEAVSTWSQRLSKHDETCASEETFYKVEKCQDRL